MGKRACLSTAASFTHHLKQKARACLPAGFTLIELLVVIAIIGVLAVSVIATLNPAGQLAKADDARRKSDLHQIQHALELYYQDHNEYPHPDLSGLTAPYIQKLPSDPKPGKIYKYVVAGDYQSYQLYASLDRSTDPQACSSSDTTCTSQSCGSASCNYGVSSSNTTP